MQSHDSDRGSQRAPENEAEYQEFNHDFNGKKGRTPADNSPEAKAARLRKRLRRDAADALALNWPPREIMKVVIGRIRERGRKSQRGTRVATPERVTEEARPVQAVRAALPENTSANK